jgi:hypothetical protein
MFRVYAALAAAMLVLAAVAAPVGGIATAQPAVHKKAAPGGAPRPAISRPAPAPRVFTPQRSAAPPRMVAPQRTAPHIAAPRHHRIAPHVAAPRHHRGAPSIAAPRHRVAPAFRHRSVPTVQRAAPANRMGHRFQQRLLRQRNADHPRRSQEAVQQRIQRLQAQHGRLNRFERRELRRLKHANRGQVNVQTNPERLQQLRERGRLNRAERRELRRLQRAQQIFRQQQQNQIASQPRRARTARFQHLTPQQAAQSRFASRFNRQHGTSHRANRRAARLAALAAWKLGLLAAYVPWRGPIYWPYAYNDIFYYTFWPGAYEPGYWAYVYDDFFDGIFFPYGAPYVEYAHLGPYEDVEAGSTTGTARRQGVPGRVSQPARDFCAEQANGITAWPFDRIEQAVQPSGNQKEMLANLKKAANAAAEQFKDACPTAVPLTPPGRLQTMIGRLQAMRDAVQSVQPALVSFYDSLSDEQKARFNELGPNLDKQQGRAGQSSELAEADCGSQKAGLSNLATERIEQAVQPDDVQSAALDRLEEATQKAVDRLRDACPTTTPLTPVGRLEIMQKRLEALIEAANTVRPALEDFYASLSNEQKAKFNRLGRDSARSGG